MRNLLGLYVVMLLLTACGFAVTSHTLPEAEAAEETIEAVAAPKTAYTAFIVNEAHTLAKYEPPEGAYLGAYILSNRVVERDIRTFETRAARPHALYVFHMQLGDNFPINWVLSCIASMKTPYVSLAVPHVMTESDWAVLAETADAFGAFHVPMFLEFAPLDRTQNANTYVETFRRARRVFRRRAPYVAFVWSVNSTEVYGSALYYPGHDYVDWVGMSIFLPLGTAAPFERNVLHSIDYFYYTYQRHKPIMITRLAISHKSARNFAYRTDAAAAEIQRLYNAFAQDYPRIKGVIIMDFDAITRVNGGAIGENFSITSEQSVLNAYNLAISQPHFLSTLDVSTGGETARATYRSPFTAYYSDGRFFVSETLLHHDLEILDVTPFGEAVWLNGMRFFNINNVPGAAQRVTFRRLDRDIMKSQNRNADLMD